jgi:uncharacterized protein (DUF58 family)
MTVLDQARHLASGLPPLLVAAQRIAATVLPGVHGRRRAGQGDTFWQFRRYQPGDSPRRIDWRQSAKADPLFVREMEWAAAESVWLWRDGSASMRYASGPIPRKIDRADLFALALAALLLRGGERVGLLGHGLRPSNARSTLERMALALGRPDAAASSVPPDEPLPRHARLILVSDFLSPVGDLAAALRRYADRGVRGHLLRVIDPAEESLPFEGRVRFEGAESEGETLVSRVEGVREAYLGRFKAHEAAVAGLARNLGWTLAANRTDHSPQPALLALYLQVAEPGSVLEV